MRRAPIIAAVVLGAMLAASAAADTLDGITIAPEVDAVQRVRGGWASEHRSDGDGCCN